MAGGRARQSGCGGCGGGNERLNFMASCLDGQTLDSPG